VVTERDDQTAMLQPCGSNCRKEETSPNWEGEKGRELRI